MITNIPLCCKNCGCGLNPPEEEDHVLCTFCQGGEVRVRSVRNRRSHALHEREIPGAGDTDEMEAAFRT